VSIPSVGAWLMAGAYGVRNFAFAKRRVSFSLHACVRQKGGPEVRRERAGRAAVGLVYRLGLGIELPACLVLYPDVTRQR
jgi:hypothetical protein